MKSKKRKGKKLSAKRNVFDQVERVTDAGFTDFELHNIMLECPGMYKHLIAVMSAYNK